MQASLANYDSAEAVKILSFTLQPLSLNPKQAVFKMKTLPYRILVIRESGESHQ